MKKQITYIEEYVNINGIKQYFLHYPCNSEWVILFLHGDPGQSESLFQYAVRPAENFCSFVYYDQRGAGKTNLKNKSLSSEVTMASLLADLSETICYIKGKYHTEKIILLGHSWGSVLGTTYVKMHPHDVCGYIGMGQVISMFRGERLAYERLDEFIKTANIEKDINTYASFDGYPFYLTTINFTKEVLRFRRLQKKYGMVGITGSIGKQVKIILKSPVFRFSDIIPMLNFSALNKHLMDYLIEYDIYDDQVYEIPIFYLCGREDWQVPSTLAAEYFKQIQAPIKALFWIENAGHLTDIDNPSAYNEALKKIVEILKQGIKDESDCE